MNFKQEIPKMKVRTPFYPASPILYIAIDLTTSQRELYKCIIYDEII